MNNLVLIAAHFPPSNLAGVHRARLWAQHLHEFGWKPKIITTHWRHYEEPLDWDLHALLPAGLEVLHTSAFPVGPLRAIGDIGLRAFVFHLRELRRLAERGEVDFLHITIPSFYSALLGPLLWRSHRVPYGIDYIDPWVHDWPGAERRFSRAWFAHHLSRVLEPMAVRHARLITGISPGYYEGVLERNPHLKTQVVTAAMPYGASEQDFDGVRVARRPPTLFDPTDGGFHLIYAGALLPKARVVLTRLCEAVALLRDQSPFAFKHLRIHFVGTGGAVFPEAQKMGLADTFIEHPPRMAYTEVLNHLCHAQAVLVLGSTEAHYSPSKVYQAVHSHRPVLALLHEQSSAVRVLTESGAGEAITFNESRLPMAADLAARLEAFIQSIAHPRRVDWAAFEPYSARESARTLASALNLAVEHPS